MKVDYPKAWMAHYRQMKQYGYDPHNSVDSHAIYWRVFRTQPGSK